MCVLPCLVQSPRYFQETFSPNFFSASVFLHKSDLLCLPNKRWAGESARTSRNVKVLGFLQVLFFLVQLKLTKKKCHSPCPSLPPPEPSSVARLSPCQFQLNIGNEIKKKIRFRCLASKTIRSHHTVMEKIVLVV